MNQHDLDLIMASYLILSRASEMSDAFDDHESSIEAMNMITGSSMETVMAWMYILDTYGIININDWRLDKSIGVYSTEVIKSINNLRTVIEKMSSMPKFRNVNKKLYDDISSILKHINIRDKDTIKLLSIVTYIDRDINEDNPIKTFRDFVGMNPNLEREYDSEDLFKLVDLADDLNLISSNEKEDDEPDDDEYYEGTTEHLETNPLNIEEYLDTAISMRDGRIRNNERVKMIIPINPSNLDDIQVEHDWQNKLIDDLKDLVKVKERLISKLYDLYKDRPNALLLHLRSKGIKVGKVYEAAKKVDEKTVIPYIMDIPPIKFSPINNMSANANKMIRTMSLMRMDDIIDDINSINTDVADSLLTYFIDRYGPEKGSIELYDMISENGINKVVEAFEQISGE